MKKVWLAILIALGVYTAMDILIWQGVYEPDYRYLTILKDQIFNYVVAWWLVLIGFLLLGALFLWPNIKQAFFYVGATLTLAHSGLEDILYYQAVGKAIPEQLPWLNHAPLILGSGMTTPTQLYLSLGVWLIFWLLMTIWMIKEK